MIIKGWAEKLHRAQSHVCRVSGTGVRHCRDSGKYDVTHTISNLSNGKALGIELSPTEAREVAHELLRAADLADRYNGQ